MVLDEILDGSFFPNDIPGVAVPVPVPGMHPVSDQEKLQDRGRQGNRRAHQQPRGVRTPHDVAAGLGDHPTPIGCRGLHAQNQERQPGDYRSCSGVPPQARR